MHEVVHHNGSKILKSIAQMIERQSDKTRPHSEYKKAVRRLKRHRPAGVSAKSHMAAMASDRNPHAIAWCELKGVQF